MIKTILTCNRNSVNVSYHYYYPPNKLTNPFYWLLQLPIWLLLQVFICCIKSYCPEFYLYFPCAFSTLQYYTLSFFFFAMGCMALSSACFLSLQNHETGRDLRDHPVPTFSLGFKETEALRS